MASTGEGLTHNEIWDDSALIDSWDQALEEYKMYHSIHKNGGNVNDLIKSKEEKTSDAKHDPDGVGESPSHAKLETASEMKEENINTGLEAGNATTKQSHPPVSGVPPAPAGLLSTMRDEGLKRLLMSWYYAGYYTGYYEGQRDPLQNQETLE
ncbi:hypothetical protein NUW58_g6109 [Xylaria curta]|uniref:Uncharacterized protein n=1 Tax=Xylaria curta TaxID=42375 RepID=A0ACC1NZE6_9PEZI|nr:hypothetical protein NUW58_g6109 [Xylaria curta]